MSYCRDLWPVVIMMCGVHMMACKNEPIAFVSRDMPGDSAFDASPDVSSDDSGSATACETMCSGMTPWCDVVTGTCVACLTAAACRDDLPNTLTSCEQNRCVYTCDQAMNPWQVNGGAVIAQQGCTCLPSDEVCDGEDNDCDGEVDNLPMLACALNTGVCEGASVRCEGDAQSYNALCSAQVYQAHAAMSGERYDADMFESLLCDGEDNNCDGRSDEGCCAQGAPARPVRVANASLRDQFRLLEASAASPHQGYHAVAFLEDEQTLRVLEYDQHLVLVAQGTHSFPGKRIKVFDVMTTPTGYMISLGFHLSANSSARGASMQTMVFYSVPAESLSPEGTLNLLNRAQSYEPFKMTTSQDRVTQLRMVNDGDQILFVWELIYEQEHSLSTCSTTFANIAARAGFCVERNLLDPDIPVFWGNNAQISDWPNPHELVVERRGERVALSWELAISNMSVDTTRLHLTTLDGLDWKTFEISHAMGNPYGYRSAPRLVQWLGDEEVALLYRNEDIQTLSYIARVDALGTQTNVNAEPLPALGSGDRYLGLGLLDEGRDGSLDQLGLLYRGGALTGSLSLGLVQRAVSQPAVIQSVPALMTTQRDEVNARIQTHSSPFGMVSLVPYSAAGELELVEVNHEGDMVCRP